MSLVTLRHTSQGSVSIQYKYSRHMYGDFYYEKNGQMMHSWNVTFLMK